MHVAVRELKSHLSQLLALAKAGESIEIRSHNKPIARLIGIPPQADEGMQGLMRSGTLSWNGKKPHAFQAVELRQSGTPISHMVMEGRG